MIDLEVGARHGYRMFRLLADGTLTSYSAPYVWTVGANQASCESSKRHGHGPVPALRCGCGFWLYRDLGRCARMLRHELVGRGYQIHGPFGDFEAQRGAVLAECRAWGRVLEGADGWRSEWAAIDAVLDIGQKLDIETVAEHYEVPIVAEQVDLSVTVSGVLTDRDPEVGADGRIGIRLDSRRLTVSTATRSFIELWKAPLGTALRLSLDPETGEVTRVRSPDTGPTGEH